MFNNNFDPLQDLMELQASQLRLDRELIELQKQLFQSVMTQQEIVQAINNQAKSINSLHAIIKDHIESTYQPK